jgi:hypothetical protein
MLMDIDGPRSGKISQPGFQCGVDNWIVIAFLALQCNAFQKVLDKRGNAGVVCDAETRIRLNVIVYIQELTRQAV